MTLDLPRWKRPSTPPGSARDDDRPRDRWRRARGDRDDAGGARQGPRCASPSRSRTGRGGSTSGRRRRCCWASGCRRWGRSRAGRRAAAGGTRSIPSSQGWTEHDWRDAGFRAVAGSVVRRSAYVAPGVVLMPSFVNVGAYVGEGTMVDTWVTVGSCAQIGRQRASLGRGRDRRGAGADAGGADDHRGWLLRRRALGGGRGLHRARGVGAGDGGLHRAVDEDRRPGDGRDLLRRGAALFGGGGGESAGQAAAGRRAGAEPLLRGDRQAGGRADAVEDRRSTSCCATDAGGLHSGRGGRAGSRATGCRKRRRGRRCSATRRASTRRRRCARRWRC